MQLGTRVKELCRKRGISVAKIERAAGIPEKSISKWDTNIPSFDKVERVVNALEISFDEFMGNDNVRVELNIPRTWYDTIEAAAYMFDQPVEEFIIRHVLNDALIFVHNESEPEERPLLKSTQSPAGGQTTWKK